MVKKIAGILLALTLIVPTVQANSLAEPYFGASENVKNGTFAALDTGWTVTGENPFTTEDGNTYLAPAAAGSGVSQLVTGLTANTMYECTFSMKSSVGSTVKIGIVQKNVTDGTAVDVAAVADGETWEKIVKYSFTYTGIYESWTDFRFTFVVPAGGNAIELFLGANAADSALAFDNISVRRTENLIFNGSFEEEAPTCIQNNAGTTDLPCQWKGWKDGFMNPQFGKEGNGIAVLANNASVVQYFDIPLEAGRLYQISFDYTVKRRYPDEDKWEDVSQYLVNNMAYAVVEFEGGSKNAASETVTGEGVWATKTYPFRPGTGIDKVTLRFKRRSGSNYDSSDKLVICYDNVRVQLAPGETNYYIGDTAATEMPKLGEALTVKRTHYNHENDPIQATMIVCIYKEVGGAKQLVGFSVSDTVTIQPNQNTSEDGFKISVTMTEKEAGATYYAETFIWDSVSGLSPRTEKDSFPKVTAE